MYIKVNFDTLSYEDVCAYYNKHKPEDWKPIQRLDRIEGGFMIEMNSKPKHYNENENIRQVRWSRKCLFTPIGYYGFSEEEIDLLHIAFNSIYGPESAVLCEGSGPPIR